MRQIEARDKNDLYAHLLTIGATMSKTLSLLLAFAMASTCFAVSPEDPTPTEIGTVKWHRDFNAAKTLSQKSGKPLLLLFQEVPG